MSTSEVSICGLMFCYNEEHIIRETVEHYLSMGIDLVVFDNCSTDCSLARINEAEKSAQQGRILQVVSVLTTGFEWHKILRYACNYMHENLAGYKWIMVIDADAFYCSPVRDMHLREYLRHVGETGCNIVLGRLFNFYPTDADPPNISSVFNRMRFCEIDDRLLQPKIFRYHPTVDFALKGGHRIARKDPKYFGAVKFIYRHYPWVSFAHGIQKIFTNRRPRFVEREEYPEANYHWHYGYLLPQKRDLVLNHADLTIFDQLRLVSSADFNLILRESAHEAPCITDPVSIRRRSFSTGGIDIRTEAQTLHYHQLIRKAYCKTLPLAVHMLLNSRSHCNANCYFCNQAVAQQPQGEMRIDIFRIMLENIAHRNLSRVYFSGGGEPLVAEDFVSMVELQRACLPNAQLIIRTNGIRLDEFAEKLASYDGLRVEVSLHGLDETNDDILGVNGASRRIWQGIERFGQKARKYGIPPDISLSICVSNRNIDELPDLVRRAAEISISRVNVHFVKYFRTDSAALFAGESLYYHQGHYRRVIDEAERIAKVSNLRLRHEGLFEPWAARKICPQPWRLAVVRWDGSVFPCCGGEVTFAGKVDSGACDFGNVVTNHIATVWNNEAFIKLRRTCLLGSRECHMRECIRCHNNMALDGPAEEHSHFIGEPP